MLNSRECALVRNMMLLQSGDHSSTTIYVRFPIAKASQPEIEAAAIVIWTTTPWTIPGNRAVNYSPRINYGLYEVTAAENSLE